MKPIKINKFLRETEAKKNNTKKFLHDYNILVCIYYNYFTRYRFCDKHISVR